MAAREQSEAPATPSLDDMPFTSSLPGGGRVMAPLCSVFRRHLRDHDLKYTPERAGVLDTIIEVDDVFEADSLLELVRKRGFAVSKATVYRTLKLLQEAGIIVPVLFDTRQSHYQLVYGRRPRDHMTCIRTGRRIEFTDDDILEIRRRVAERHGWEAVGHRFQVFAVSPPEDDDATAPGA